MARPTATIPKEDIITPEQKAARAAKAREARAEAARKRSEAVEAEQIREIKAVWDRIPQETQRVFEYIRKEIASGRRDYDEVAFLRETRSIHFAPFRRMIQKEG